MGRDPGPPHAHQITWAFHELLIRLLFPQLGSFHIRHRKSGTFEPKKIIRMFENFSQQDSISIDFTCVCDYDHRKTGRIFIQSPVFVWFCCDGVTEQGDLQAPLGSVD